MERIVEQALLYDFYGELLTKHQKQIFEDHVLNDLSVSEIAAERGISRQGVHDMLKRCDKILSDYEEKLKLIEKFLRTKEKVETINHLANSMKDGDETMKQQCIGEIERVSRGILEDF
ncbi:MAG: YlxM family DNA-binding protein [Lachnospiraceae bacterium]|nr:YlxM family DNA-binding protein [Lachnospiraceae bacterium]